MKEINYRNYFNTESLVESLNIRTDSEGQKWLDVDVPGFERKDIDVKVENYSGDSIVSVSANKEAKNGFEAKGFQQYYRIWDMELDLEKTKATLDLGVLSIKLVCSKSNNQKKLLIE